MTSNKHDFVELDAPSTVAEKLGISVATLRKYSLIVETVTGNKNYYERNKQRSRLYHQKDIEDLDAFYKLSKQKGLTLKEAARQIYAVSDKVKVKKPEKSNEMMDPHQVAKLLGALQQTIATQNEAIDNLQKQLNRIEQQNKELIKNQLSNPPKKDDHLEKIAAMPDISGIVDPEEEEAPLSQADKRKKLVEDSQKSEEDLHSEILRKARENAEKRATGNIHRTLADMQLQPQKKHWWQKLF